MSQPPDDSVLARRLDRERKARHEAEVIAERATRELYQALQDVQRTVEELRISNEALERSNIELQQFAYVASHDLQSPLRSISGFVQLLQRDYQGRLDERADDWIRRTIENVELMQQLIQELLAYCRVDSQARPFAPTDLCDVFDDAVAVLEASIRDGGGRVTRDPLPTVHADRSQLVQLFQNLIGNAIKYRGRQPPRVHVAAEAKGPEWVFAVRDNGIGIDPKHVERVFEVFQRLHTHKAYPGTGIGLAICRRVTHRHGGKIWVESKLGQGSTFFFTLPRTG